MDPHHGILTLPVLLTYLHQQAEGEVLRPWEGLHTRAVGSIQNQCWEESCGAWLPLTQLENESLSESSSHPFRTWVEMPPKRLCCGCTHRNRTAAEWCTCLRFSFYSRCPPQYLAALQNSLNSSLPIRPLCNPTPVTTNKKRPSLHGYGRASLHPSLMQSMDWEQSKLTEWEEDTMAQQMETNINCLRVAFCLYIHLLCLPQPHLICEAMMQNGLTEPFPSFPMPCQGHGRDGGSQEASQVGKVSNFFTSLLRLWAPLEAYAKGLIGTAVTVQRGCGSAVPKKQQCRCSSLHVPVQVRIEVPRDVAGLSELCGSRLSFR